MLFRSATFGGHSFREIKKQTFGTIDLAKSLKHPNFPKNPDPSIHHANLKPSFLVAITYIKPSFLMVLWFKGGAYFEDPKTPLRHTVQSLILRVEKKHTPNQVTLSSIGLLLVIFSSIHLPSFSLVWFRRSAPRKR